MIALDRGFDRMGREGRAQIAFASAALEQDLVRYKLMAKMLAEIASGASPPLERATGLSGARRIMVRGPGEAEGPLGRAVDRAMQGAIGLDYDPGGGGAFIIAVPVWSAEQAVSSIAVEIEAAALEWSWRALPEVLFFTGTGGRVQFASLPALRGRATHSSEGALPARQARVLGGHAFWRLDAPDWAALGIEAREVMLISRPAPVVEMTAFMLLDTALARRSALIVGLGAGAGAFALGLIGLVLLQRRAAMAQALAIKARANELLEGTVERRTRALRDEVIERRQAETALRAAQDELVQAGKMSALGQMAAGIAHELNQPLTAIRGFADNAVLLLQRGRGEEAESNLSRISDMTGRTARIIRNLRAFARGEPEPAGPVALRPVIEDALTLLAPRIRETGADIRVEAEEEVWAMGGAVRLQQVVLNLVSNALDAGGAAPVEIALAPGDPVRLTVRDHGPGVAPADKARIFEPFFTTKGAAEGGEGMGLGLSISYQIVRSFGGELRVETHADGGALFTIELKPAAAKADAA